MKITNGLLGRFVTVVSAVAMVVGIASIAQADQPWYSLSGNARFQIGGGLPIPITGAAIPNDRINARPDAVVHQTAGADPKALRIPPNQLVNGGPFAPTYNVNAPVFLNNPNVFQVRTKIPIQFPNASATFEAGGRTGAATVRYCAGQVVPPAGNPNCGAATALAGVNGVKGRLIYTATGNQFGGPAQGSLQGSADVALFGGGAPPGSVMAIFYLATPAGTGAQGGPFGFFVMSANAIPNPSGMGNFIATAGGKLQTVVLANQGAGLGNPPTSYGGPWTTGTLTVSQAAAAGGGETFTLVGNDGRVNGIGPISLVSGAISARTLSGPNANRGWLNLVVGAVPTPAISGYGLAAAFGLLALAGVYAVRKSIRS